MPTNYPVPSGDNLRAILADLLGRGVTVGKGDPIALERDTPAVIADFVSDDGPLAVLCLADLRLANSLGAALTMVPPSAVEEAVKKWQIDDTCIENFQEVANIMTRLFNSDDTPHLRFRQVHKLPADLPEETAELLREPLARRNLDVNVEDYGAGKLAVIVA